MKTQIRSLLTLVCAVSASWLITASPAQAGYLVTLDQVGSNVVATGSGPIDLTGLTFDQSAGFSPQVDPTLALITTGPTAMLSQYHGVSSGPKSFGPGAGALADSGSGDIVGINGSAGLLFVPQGYVSGGSLSDTSTYNNATFASLGVTPGTYEWTWGTGANQNFTLEIGAAGVPDTCSTFGLLVVALSALFGASRFRALRLA